MRRVYKNMCPAKIRASIIVENTWKNSLKNVESDNNKILYEILLDFFFLQRKGSYFLSKHRISISTSISYISISIYILYLYILYLYHYQYLYPLQYKVLYVILYIKNPYIVILACKTHHTVIVYTTIFLKMNPRFRNTKKT